MKSLRTFLVLAVILSACNRASEPASATAAEPQAAPPAPAPAATPTKKMPDTRPVLVCFGDSLTAGFGVEENEAFPALLQEEVAKKGINFRVINAGISGETTAGGLDRLAQVIAVKPAAVLLELGANDGLRGMPIEVTRKNLDQMITAMKGAGISVVIAGMTLPRNYGADFIQKFEALYADLAKQHKIPLVKFDLEPLAKKRLLQADGMHPTAEGYRVALPMIYAGLESTLKARQ